MKAISINKTGMRSIGLALCAALPALATVAYPPRPPEQEANAHDPAVFKDADAYYVYATHGAPVFRSRDLVAFEKVVEKALPEAPERARAHVGGRERDTIWAPDMVKVGDQYRLYYCLSKFGTSQSYIGFATAPSPTGPFTDAGRVIASTQPTEKPHHPNALDPSILVDADGLHWMVYGSFFGGIHAVRLEPTTGERRRDEIGDRIAYRHNTALEGPCAIYHPALKHYFLFVSYDKLDSTYNVRVGRSKRPGGPYKDFRGKDLAGEEDNLPKILNSYAFENHPGWHGPGHNSVLRDGNDYFMVHHARVEIDGRKQVRLHVRKMVFTDDGWPVVSPERYAGEREQPIPERAMAGRWEFLPIDPADNGMQQARTGLVFEPKGVLRFGAETGTWKIDPPNSLHFKLGKREAVGAKVLPAWDWENDRPTLVFTGLDKAGVAVWGKRGDGE